MASEMIQLSTGTLIRVIPAAETWDGRKWLAIEKRLNEAEVMELADLLMERDDFGGITVSTGISKRENSHAD